MTSYRVAGGTLFRRELGAGDPVLLLHGLGSSGADWAFQVPPLMNSYRLILPDLPGSGQSAPPAGPFSIASIANELWRMMDAMVLPRAHIVGFSLGGAVALEMALQRPNAVDRLVLINSLPSYRVDHWKKWLELYLQIGVVRVLGLPRAARMVAARLFPLPHQAAMRKRVSEVVGSRKVGPYLASARALAEWCAVDRLQGFKTTTLMIAGEHDYTPLAEKRAWAQRMNAELVVVRNSRHGTPFDATEATNACLMAFLTQQPMPGASELVADTAESTPSAAPISLD